ncbi:MAG: bacillithiol biosynthesis cysteine-adding enzyme BshC [Acidobacteria bacterium]|nr:bacillithiol biosynthesis cysteine-adding enzyme BshC [Acidobacteriota bacterium]
MPAEPTIVTSPGVPQPPDAAGSARIGVDVRKFAWFRPLAGDYAYNFPNIASLYAGNPSSPDAWRAVIARRQQQSHDGDAVAGVLAAQQQRRGAPPSARAAAARLAEPGVVAVVSGQQAGAFGGPLFTLLKAITALQLAKRTEAEHGVPCVPVFWVDAEDHDWDEVGSCTVLDDAHHPRTVTIPKPDGGGEQPVASLVLDERIVGSIGELEAALSRTDFTDWVLAGVRTHYQPGAGMADAFARWLETLLGPHGLVVFDSSDPAAKPLASAVFARELASPGRTAALATTAGDALAARGHEPQVTPNPDSVALFHLGDGRRAIRRQGDRYLVGDTLFTAEALAEDAAAHPERLSPNVLLRPIVQDTLFPTICYVAGPSELAYLGQLGGVYEHFGLPMPLMYPRASATIVDAAALRFVTRYHVALDELQKQDESALNRLLHSQLPAEVEQSLGEADENIRRTMQRVIEAMPALDPTMAGAARTTLGRMEHELRTLQNKVIQAAKRRDETLRRQFTRAQTQFYPLGDPQERTLAVVFFLNRYGPALVDRLMDQLPLDLGQHWIMTI